MPRTIPGEKLLQVVRGPNSVLFIGLGCVGTWENPHPLANGTGGMSHPFNDQMEYILLCVPRDQSHVS
jgi:hypothetical protein